MFIFKIFCLLFIAISTFASTSEKLIGQNQKNVNTDVTVISYQGQIVFENYQNEYSFKKPHLSWSVAKTLTGFLIAIASEEYKFSLQDPIKKFIPEFKSHARIIDLLQMSSGINFTEDYFGLPVSSDVVKMLYLDGSEVGASQYVLSLPHRKDNMPGDHFYYSSGDTNLLMEILYRVINDKEIYLNYPWTKLFNPLGITTATLELDKNNIFIGSSYMYFSPEDYLKLAQLIIYKGLWNGTRIIPEFYIQFINVVAPGVQKRAIEGASPFRAYSSQVTTNLPLSEKKLNSEYPFLPTDSLALIGHQGQLLIASPKEKLIILRLAMDKGSAFDRKSFFENVYHFLLEKNLKVSIAKEQKIFPDNFIVQQEKVPNKLKFVDLFNIAKLIRRYSAKEICSCYFVTGRSLKACEKDISVSMPIMPKLILDDSKESKRIKARFFWGTEDSATFLNEKYGCRIDNN